VQQVAAHAGTAPPYNRRQPRMTIDARCTRIWCITPVVMRTASTVCIRAARAADTPCRRPCIRPRVFAGHTRILRRLWRSCAIGVRTTPGVATSPCTTATYSLTTRRAANCRRNAACAATVRGRQQHPGGVRIEAMHQPGSNGRVPPPPSPDSAPAGNWPPCRSRPPARRVTACRRACPRQSVRRPRTGRAGASRRSLAVYLPHRASPTLRRCHPGRRPAFATAPSVHAALHRSMASRTVRRDATGRLRLTNTSSRSDSPPGGTTSTRIGASYRLSTAACQPGRQQHHGLGSVAPRVPITNG